MRMPTTPTYGVLISTLEQGHKWAVVGKLCPREVVLYMKQGTLVSLPVKELNKLPLKQREAINWYHEAGLPAPHGTVTSAIRRVVKVRKE